MSLAERRFLTSSTLRRTFSDGVESFTTSQRDIHVDHQVSDPRSLAKVKYHQHRVASALAESSNQDFFFLQAVNRGLNMVFTRVQEFFVFFKDDYACRAALPVKHKDVKTGGT